MEFEHEKIEELLKLEQDNNKMLHRMRRSMIWGRIFTFLYWLIIIGAVGSSYYYLQPYVTKYWNTYQSAVKTLNNVEKMGNSIPSGLGNMLEKPH